MRAVGLAKLSQLCVRRIEGVAAQYSHQSQAASTVASPPNQLENSISPEDRELNLEILRRHNSSLKQLKGQTIGARIFRTDKRFVFLDTGFNKHVKFARKALQISQLISSRDGGVRTSPEDFRVGDVLKFVVEEVETAYGDMQLSTEREVASDKFQRVWDIIKQAMRENKPVMGRVLNTVPGGYCIGIAGVVAFCPFSSIAGPTARRIGVLQPFHVLRMEDSRQNIVLLDSQKTPSPNRNNVGYKQDSLASRYSPQHVRGR
ncbi:g6128 [Coccomyxa viridis]|uniref:G6128 protein n=1 Tax=Coccomyxa viridis TaxID=1274662 RepID=A0ABP1FUM6_9CHLO